MIIKNDQNLIKLIQNHKLGIIPTDTIYGFVCCLTDKKNIEKIYKIKKRPWDKKILILVSSWKQLKTLIDVNQKIIDYIIQTQEPTTIIYPTKRKNKTTNQKQFYKDTIAIRFVKWEWLKSIISKTGPIVSSSCNFSGKKSITNFQELFQFENLVDFIHQGESQKNKPSQIIDWKTKLKIR